MLAQLDHGRAVHGSKSSPAGQNHLLLDATVSTPWPFQKRRNIALCAKYPQYHGQAPPGPVLRLEPERALVWRAADYPE